jgi:hypothetical protein
MHLKKQKYAFPRRLKTITVVFFIEMKNTGLSNAYLHHQQSFPRMEAAK